MYSDEQIAKVATMMRSASHITALLGVDGYVKLDIYNQELTKSEHIITRWLQQGIIHYMITQESTFYKDYQNIADMCMKTEVLLIISASLVASPTNELALLTRRCGGKLIVIHCELTHMDSLAEVIIHDNRIAEVLEQIEEKL